MSRVFEALQRVNGNADLPWRRTDAAPPPLPPVARMPEAQPAELDGLRQTFLPGSTERLVALRDQDSLAAEKFRVLAVRLRTVQKRRQIKKILITSSIKGEGKSVISANLAATLAQRQKTLLIDGDLHQSGLKEVLAAKGLPGLTDWWLTADPINKFLHRLDGLSLWYLPAGIATERPLEILQSARLQLVLNEIAAWFDWVIIDSPPLVPVADAGVWLTQVDATLLVVKQGQTPRKMLSEALESVENMKLLGIILNEQQHGRHQYYREYYKNSGHGGTFKTRSPAPAQPSSVSVDDPI